VKTNGKLLPQQTLLIELEHVLETFTLEERKSLFEYWEHRDKSHVLRRDWWHQKFYRRKDENEKNDGFVEQSFALKSIVVTEKPYTREMFYNSDGRFGLPNKPVAYFSDWLTGTCEMLPAFRDNPLLTSEELELYMSRKLDPDPTGGKLCGYPRVFFLHPDVVILNLSRPTASFFSILQNKSRDLFGFVVSSIMSRDKSCYLLTQVISSFAHKFGFHGALYRSVRIPRDWHFTGGENLVLFCDQINGVPIVERRMDRIERNKTHNLKNNQ